MKKTGKPTVLFYTSIPRLFRTTLMGHLYEIAQKYPTVVLAEKLDQETLGIINNKNLFPNVVEVVNIESPFHGKIIKKNMILNKVIKDTVLKYRPGAVLALNDVNPAELYLMRSSRKIGAVNIVMQAALRAKKLEDLALFSTLNSAYFRLPAFLPFGFRIFLTRAKKIVAYYVYYWFLPLTAGQAPFWGKSSFTPLKGTPGMRDSDYYIVFSKREYDISLDEGAPEKKLYILSHPLARNVMNKFLQGKSFKKEGSKKVLTLMYSVEEISFRKKDHKFLLKDELLQSRIKMVGTTAKVLKDWQIFIKPHPSMAELPDLLNQTQKTFESISSQVKVTNPQDPADKYIEASDVIVGMPPMSNTLFTASLQCPEKIIISIDLNQEFLGDSYKGFDGIEYIDDQEKFVKVLEMIRDNKIIKKNNFQAIKQPKEFTNAIEVLEFALNNNKNVKIKH